MTESPGKKYELLPFDGTRSPSGEPLNRIMALRDIPQQGVREGDIEGYVAPGGNLSHEGLCWVHDDARVYGRAHVYGDAVMKDSLIHGGTFTGTSIYPT